MNPSIESFLREEAIAVVGVSRTRGFANGALRKLRDTGHRAYPVNASADEVHGERCFRRLDDLPERPGAVLVVVPPSQALEVVRDCARLGLRKVWLQQGSESEEALLTAEAAGIDLVHHDCVLMHASPRGIHRLHRWIEARRGRV